MRARRSWQRALLREGDNHKWLEQRQAAEQRQQVRPPNQPKEAHHQKGINALCLGPCVPRRAGREHVRRADVNCVGCALTAAVEIEWWLTWARVWAQDAIKKERAAAELQRMQEAQAALKGAPLRSRRAPKLPRRSARVRGSAGLERVV
jgi:hypothetical protein